MMNRIKLIAIAGLALSALPPGSAFAQNADSVPALAGSWTLVRVDNLLPDGTRIHLYGDNPQGMLVFDAHGRYALQMMRGDNRKFASNDRSEATPAEYKAAVTGSNAHFGRYTVNENAHTITFHIDHASFPNWEGTEQIRKIQIDGDTLTYIVPTPTSGAGATGEVQWRRLN
ncbi:MAG: lipocalin-like domain-containing protein [Pseudomonadota bacterium]|jgi:hypothetical protein|uniref:lipocalin-like domain-containing protein n=1 Tax=Burkholderiaceae TaxID=119060 RepID=UPI0010F5180C|nr:lipocalin-like domain-containing protein [Burkholderia sp. 4M9327F10]